MRRDTDEAALPGREESLLRHAVQHVDQRIEESADVDKHDRLGVIPELIPCSNFHQFIKCAETSREDCETVRQFIHQGLAFVHAVDDEYLAARVARLLLFVQCERGDASHGGTGLQRGPGHGPHHPGTTGAVDEVGTATAELLAQRRRGIHVVGDASAA